ncbi:MAG: S8 family serine peptidase [Brevundimonas sp.]|uniref:S8 family serine peptidase n=1 Tax=Brevundimonas sp. TaxID=1871086 RepID=UPI0024892545|nr:S8 family serine peptidase [Brevundimonas sp.]MDI1326085.1 S8 family serine peptidase [Brevundimonas sp.]
MTKTRTSIGRWMVIGLAFFAMPEVAVAQGRPGGSPRPDAAIQMRPLVPPAPGVAGPQSRPSAIPQLPSVPVTPEAAAGRMSHAGQAQGVADAVLQAPARSRAQIQRSNGILQADPFGWPVVSGEIVAIGLSDRARAEALGLGYHLIREESLPDLEMDVLVFSPPAGQQLSDAVERLARLDPQADIGFNHVYSPAGAVSMAPSPVIAPQRVGSSVRLGLIDTGVAAHPALAGSDITQQGFAGPVHPGAHGTAVASLMVGEAGFFSGTAPGAGLLVADVYGGSAAGGSSTALARALAWMSSQRIRVVNVSLVGPRNPVVARAVAQAQARGMTIVAAVGNDGPAAPPLYPAAYEGVIGVSAVNGRGRPLPETGRGPQVDFSAPGADIAAASVSGGYVTVRGSSFAAPLVAGLIARHGETNVARHARDMGAPGRDDIYGRGLVGNDMTVAPRAVGAHGALRR